MMFTLVLPDCPPKNPLFRLVRPVRLEEHRTMGVRWRLIRLASAHRHDWNRVARLAGRHRGRLVMPEGLHPPDGVPVGRVEPLALQRVLAAHCICRVIDAGSPVGILDPDGVCLSAAEVLLRRAGCVKVCTDRPDRWEFFARQMLQRQGAPVLLCRSPALMEDCAAFLVGGRGEWSDWLPRNPFAAAAFEPPPGCSAAWRFQADPPPGTDLPDGVDPTLLLGALYEFGAQRSLADLQPTACLWQGRRCTAESLEKTVKNTDFVRKNKA